MNNWEPNFKNQKIDLMPNQTTEYQLFVGKLFRFFLPQHKRDKVSGNLMINENQTWSLATSIIDRLQSHAVDLHGINYKRVSIHLARYESELNEELLIKIPEWDGRDRIKEIAHHTEAKNFTKNQIEEVLKNWGANVFRRIDDPVKNQNEIIALVGGQGIGKDYLINTLISGFGIYQAPFSFFNDIKDTYGLLAEKLVLNISELDKIRPSDHPKFKDIITKSHIVYRPPYARAAKSFKVSTSFIASVNSLNFLSDTTGNRRFIPVRLNKIDWGYSTNSEQITAQYYHHYNEGYQLSSKTKFHIQSVTKDLTPEDPIRLALAELSKRMKELEKKGLGQKGWFCAENELGCAIADVAKLFSIRIVDLQKGMKNEDYKIIAHKRSNGIKYACWERTT